LRVTPEDAKRIATDTEVPYARAAVPRLLSEMDRVDVAQPSDSPSPVLGRGAECRRLPKGWGVRASLTAARDTLRSWNMRADLDSRGCGLYLYWLSADRNMRLL